MRDIWDEVLELRETNRALHHQFDLRFEDVVADLMWRRGEPDNVDIVSGEERSMIATAILADLRKPVKLSEYDQAIADQEAYAALEGRK